MKHEYLSEQVIGVFYTIYNELGHGFLESIYQRAFAVVLAEKGVPFGSRRQFKSLIMVCRSGISKLT